MKHIYTYNKLISILENRSEDTVDFQEYSISLPGKIGIHNYDNELQIFSPLFLTAGINPNYDYGGSKQYFLIIPNTKIVRVRSSNSVVSVIDLDELEVSTWTIEKLNSLLSNRSNKKLFKTVESYSDLFNLLNILNSNDEEYITFMIKQLAAVDYLKNKLRLDFQILEFMKEEELVPHQYMVLDINSIKKIDEDTAISLYIPEKSKITNGADIIKNKLSIDFGLPKESYILKAIFSLSKDAEYSTPIIIKETDNYPNNFIKLLQDIRKLEKPGGLNTTSISKTEFFISDDKIINVNHFKPLYDSDEILSCRISFQLIINNKIKFSQYSYQLLYFNNSKNIPKNIRNSWVIPSSTKKLILDFISPDNRNLNITFN